MLDALSPQRRRLVFATAALAVLLAVAVVAGVIVRSRSNAVTPVPQDRLGPVLLVPGYGGNLTSLNPLATALRSAGRQVVLVPPVGDGTGDLNAQAAHLGEVAAGVLRDIGAPSVDVVGYSAGGVVARLWVQDDGGASVARRVLTVGSPQHGTSQAGLGQEFAGGCPSACEQLVPDSDLLRHLNSGDPTPEGPQWATVRSTWDRVVTPTDSAALPGAVNLLVQDVCPASRVAHGGLPGDPVTLATLGSALGVGPPRAPTGVRC